MRRKAGNPHAASFERWHARRARQCPGFCPTMRAWACSLVQWLVANAIGFPGEGGVSATLPNAANRSEQDLFWPPIRKWAAAFLPRVQPTSTLAQARPLRFLSFTLALRTTSASRAGCVNLAYSLRIQYTYCIPRYLRLEGRMGTRRTKNCNLYRNASRSLPNHADATPGDDAPSFHRSFRRRRHRSLCRSFRKP